MDAASRRPETVATRSGLRLYDVPPKKYPEEPRLFLFKAWGSWVSKDSWFENPQV